MLEEYLVEHLPQLDTFGCELTLLDADTQFCLIVHECFQQVKPKEQI